jgi:glycosyltransferase involved in cell wall biosynthesis
LKIVLATEYFYPISKGGTEMYVYQLAKELINNGHDCIVISLSNEFKEDIYEGIQVFYIPFIKGNHLESEVPENLHALISVLDKINPQIVHLHSLSPSLGVNHLVHLHLIGYTTFFTAHLPSFTCARGDLLYNGEEICDGEIIYDRCMNCILNSKGKKNKLSNSLITLASKNKFIQNLFPALGVIQNKINSLELVEKYIDEIIVVSAWQQDVLLLNKFNSSKLSICRQAIYKEIILHEKKNSIGVKLKIGYIGRIVPEKGIDVLLDCLIDIDKDNYELYVAAIKTENHLNYYHINKKLALNLNAVWKENLNSKEVISFIDEIDLLIVPSVWLETGPYVIYEALARKVPVLAFKKGGSVELINNGVDSILIGSVQDFKIQLAEFINNSTKALELSIKINMQRTTQMLYKEMETLYLKHEH